MPDGVEVDVVHLPDVIVLAWGITAMRITGTEGEEHPVVVMELQYQLEPGKVGQQSFLMHRDDARRIRADLKNPPVQEETNQ